MSGYLKLESDQIIRIITKLETEFSIISNAMRQQVGGGYGVNNDNNGSGYMGQLWHDIENDDIRNQLAILAASERKTFDYLQTEVQNLLEFLKKQTISYEYATEIASAKIQKAFEMLQQIGTRKSNSNYYQ